jgi:hypothetical protein
MKPQVVFVVLLFSGACSKGSIGAVHAAEAAPMPVPTTSAAAPSASRPVTWSPTLAGPQRSDLDRALEKPLADPWKMIDKKTKQRHDATTCRELLALDATSEPMDVSDDGSPPTPLIENDWSIYANDLIGCHLIVAVQNAKPARVDYLGPFPLNNARLNEIPAAVVPTPSDEEEAQLKKASARGVSWKGWDRRIHVTKRHGADVLVESRDTYCNLSVYGRGDFDGDGIEDVLLWVSGGGQEGTWSSSTGFVLTRRSPHGRLEVLKAIE